MIIDYLMPELKIQEINMNPARQGYCSYDPSFYGCSSSVLPERVISRFNEWPRSPDLFVFDFFHGGHLKTNVTKKKFVL